MLADGTFYIECRPTNGSREIAAFSIGSTVLVGVTLRVSQSVRLSETLSMKGKIGVIGLADDHQIIIPSSPRWSKNLIEIWVFVVYAMARCGPTSMVLRRQRCRQVGTALYSRIE